MAINSSFRAGGLASGLDTNSIVDQLVALEKRPLDMLSGRQTALKTQVTTLGDLASKLGGLQTAALALKDDGVLALKTASTPTSFAVTPTSGGAAGSFSVEVKTLAVTAKARSDGFVPGVDFVKGGTLDLTVMGQPYSVEIADGSSLSQVALAINQSAAPVSATVLSTGTTSYLTLTNRESGYPIGGVAGDALSIVETSTGSTGKALGAAIINTAVNAVVSIDGLDLTRTSNQVSDAIEGVTLSLKSVAAAEDIVLDYDAAKTKTNLDTFVSAYNSVIGLVQAQLNRAPQADRTSSLAGDATVRGLQRALQRFVSTEVAGLGTVRSLADLGIETARDGTLAIDEAKLAAAIEREPSSVDGLFSTATNGLGDLVDDFVDTYTASTTGLLTSRQAGLKSSIKDIDAQLEKMSLRLDAYKRNLIAQFTAMEKVVSSLSSIGNYLTTNPFPGIDGGKK